jgi:hypothetical protein
MLSSPGEVTMPDWIADLGSDVMRGWPTKPFAPTTPLAQALFDRPGINDIFNYINPDPEAAGKESD